MLVRHGWALRFMVRCACPRTLGNVSAIVAWATAENTPAECNPLATTLPANGATAFNTIILADGGAIHVWNYPSVDVGIDASYHTLLWTGGGKTYADLFQIMREGKSSAEQVLAEIKASPWGSGLAMNPSVNEYMAGIRRQWGDYSQRLIPGS